MAKKNKKLFYVYIVIFGLCAVFGAKAIIGSTKGKLKGGSFAKVLGPKDAPLKITEFIDFQCPACAKGAMYLKKEMEKHPGLIRLTLKHYPLSMHRHGMLSAQYVECTVAQGKFWPFYNLILTRQNNWRQLDDPVPAFQQMARDANLDFEALQGCLDGSDATKAIEKDKAEGQALRIQSTPTYFINGKMVVGQKSLELEIIKHLGENGA